MIENALPMSFTRKISGNFDVLGEMAKSSEVKPYQIRLIFRMNSFGVDNNAVRSTDQ